MYPFISAASFWNPHYVCESAWLEHSPFAFWLIEKLRPTKLVELGTHRGFSYFAFCQAVKTLGLGSDCYSVDTWAGDEHAGFYGEDVFQTVCDHNERYRSFSTLLRCQFDDALEYFPDKSIELLHINGRRCFEDVSHDFNSWVPKLSESAIVLFHDTNIRERAFGIWRLFDDLKRRHRTFEFHHGHGLGVLALNSPPGSLEPLLSLKEEEQDEVRRIYSALGGAIAQGWQLSKIRSDFAVKVADKHSVELEHQRDAARAAFAAAETERQLLLAIQSDLQDKACDMQAKACDMQAKAYEFADKNIYLLNELDKAYRKPWRPVKYFISYLVLKVFVAIAKPFSERISSRIRRSAEKRKPRRFKKALLTDAENKKLLLTEAEKTPDLQSCPPSLQDSDGDWLREFDTPDGDVLWRYAHTVNDVPSVLVVVDFESIDFRTVRRVIRSLQGVVGVNWRAILKLRRSELAPGLKDLILSEPRLWTLDEDPCASEEIVFYFNSGAALRSHSLRLMAEALLSRPDAALAYCDEDTAGPGGEFRDPWFKPSFSPFLAQQGLLLGRLIALKPSALTNQNAIDEMLSQTSDGRRLLVKFALEAGRKRVINIPHILFHNRVAPPPALPVGRPTLPDELPAVSIVVPTRDRWDLLGPCLKSLYETDWPRDRLEIIVIDNGSTEPVCIEALEAAQQAGKIVVYRDDSPFNYARLNNEAVKRATGELIVFLNNDTKAITADWLRDLAAYALLPEAGAVGPKLLYEDGTVQHGGVILSIEGGAVHAHRGLQQNEGGYQNLANITHEVVAVTGACLAVRKSKFLEVGGLNEEFRVSYNDIVLCLDLYARGYVNYYICAPLFYHYESKTRGYDDTAAKRELCYREFIQAWNLYKRLYQEDPFYSPNLSLTNIYHPSFAPRRRPWWTAHKEGPLHVLMLSHVHKKGHGVSVVLAEQARGLVERGFRVTVGGPVSTIDYDYDGCHRLDVADPGLAMRWAIKNDVDVIVAHTPPFFSIARWAGRAIPVVAYDYGEPPPEHFPDAEARREQLREKDFALHMCSRVFTISEAIKMESRTPVDGVIPPGNTHLGMWRDDDVETRNRVRSANNWNNCFVVLNVTCFHAAERHYKGVDIFIETLQHLRRESEITSECVVFVLCGRGDDEDIAFVQSSGVDVRVDVSDSELRDLYVAADAYANFSSWEGYNLGIGQALAMGLPVVASNIPAHRAFGVSVVNSAEEAAQSLLKITSDQETKRTPTLWSWNGPLDMFASQLKGIASERRGD